MNPVDFCFRDYVRKQCSPFLFKTKQKKREDKQAICLPIISSPCRTLTEPEQDDCSYSICYPRREESHYVEALRGVKSGASFLYFAPQLGLVCWRDPS